MNDTLHILIVGNDPGLAAEFHAALVGVPGWVTVTHTASNWQEALETAVNRRPQLICVQMDRDTRELRSFAREIHSAVPHTAVAAIYRPDQWATNELESGVVIDLLRSQIQDFLRRPLASTELRQLFDRVFLVRTVPVSSLGKVVSFISNKGGVGKSTLSVNAACALAQRHPGQVLLVDASLQLGICALMLNITPPNTLVDAVRQKERLDETLIRRLAGPHSSGLHLLAAPPDAVTASEVDDASVARVLNLARRCYQYVIVDTFPMLDATVISILDLSDLGYIVLQGTAPSLVGAMRFLPVLDGIGFPRERERIVLNRNYKSFPGNLTQLDIEDRLGRPIDYTFPYAKQLLMAGNTGEPYILRGNRWFGFGRAMAGMVNEIESGSAIRAEVAEPEGPDVPDVPPDVPLVRKATA